jgi:hypothetical protein
MSRKTDISFPVVCQIRKGAAKRIITKNGRQVETVGSDLGRQFRVVFAGGAETFQDLFLSATDDKGNPIYSSLTPDVLRATLTFSTVDACWECHDDAYTAGRLVARGDDGLLSMLRDPFNGDYLVRDGRIAPGVRFETDSQGRMTYRSATAGVMLIGFQPHQDGLDYEPGARVVYERAGKHIALKLRPSGKLRIWLPVFRRLVLSELVTTSYYDKLNIESQLAGIQAIASALNQGNVAGIPLLIYRRLTNISRTTEDGGAARTDKWLVCIEADPDWVSAATAMLRRNAFGSVAVPALPAGDAVLHAPAAAPDPDEDDEDDDVLEGEVTEVHPDPAPDPEPVPDVPEVERPAPAPAPAPAAPAPKSVQSTAPELAHVTLEFARWAISPPIKFSICSLRSRIPNAPAGGSIPSFTARSLFWRMRCVMGKKIRVLFTESKSDMKRIPLEESNHGCAYDRWYHASVVVAWVPAPSHLLNPAYLLFLHCHTNTDDLEHDCTMVLDDAVNDAAAIRAGIRFLDSLDVTALPVA